MKQTIFFLADDDEDDRNLFCMTLKKIDPAIICLTASDGEDALQKLSEVNQLPNIIFLDINMPSMSGWQCLTSIKKQEKLKSVPVIMYSTSSHQREIELAKDLGATAFCTKQEDLSILQELFNLIIENLDLNFIKALKEKKGIQCFA